MEGDLFSDRLYYHGEDMARPGSSIIYSPFTCPQLVRVVSVRLPRKAPGTVDGKYTRRDRQDSLSQAIDRRIVSTDIVRCSGDENENRNCLDRGDSR